MNSSDTYNIESQGSFETCRDCISSSSNINNTLSQNSYKTCESCINSSNIVTDLNILVDIYNIVRESAKAATESKNVKNLSKNTCVINLSETTNKKEKTYILKGASRFSPKCKYSDDYTIEYNPDDITIVGGSAMNLYDNKLIKLRERKQIESGVIIHNIGEYISKKTSDIDMVWWPRTKNPEVIITSSSAVIMELMKKFRDELQNRFNENRTKLFTKMKERLAVNDDSNFSIIVLYDPYKWPYTHYPKGGNHNLSIQFIIDNQELKIADIILHDTGASQNYNWDGELVRDLLPMTKDPMYIRPSSLPQVNSESNIDNSANYLNINGSKITVPNIELLVRQQLFAFKNYIKKAKDIIGKKQKSEQNKKPNSALEKVDEKEITRKALIYLQRVQFLRMILDILDLKNTKNMEDFKIIAPSLELDSLFTSIDKLLIDTRKTTLSQLSSIASYHKNNDAISTIMKDLNEIKEVGEVSVNSRTENNEVIIELQRKLFMIDYELKTKTLTTSQRLTLKANKDKIEAKIKELFASIRRKKQERLESTLKEHEAYTFKQNTIKKIVSIINELSAIESNREILHPMYLKSVQSEIKSFSEDLAGIQKTNPETLYSGKDKVDILISSMLLIKSNIERDIMYRQWAISPKTGAIWTGKVWVMPNQVNPNTGAIWLGNKWIDRDMVNPETGAIWTGVDWIGPGYINPHTRATWTGYRWFEMNEIDKKTRAIWTGYRWFDVNEVDPETNLMWSGSKWILTEGTVNARTRAIWTGNEWLPPRQFKPRTNLFWDGYRWYRRGADGFMVPAQMGRGVTRRNKNRFNRTRKL